MKRISTRLIALILALLALFTTACAEPLTGGWTPSEDPTITEARQAKGLFFPRAGRESLCDHGERGERPGEDSVRAG